MRHRFLFPSGRQGYIQPHEYIQIENSIHILGLTTSVVSWPMSVTVSLFCNKVVIHRTECLNWLIETYTFRKLFLSVPYLISYFRMHT